MFTNNKTESQEKPEEGLNNNATENKLPEYIITGDKLIGNNLTEIPKIIEPLFPKTGLIAIAGSSDTGKSSLLRQLAMNIVTGQETFIGFPIKSVHRSVLYISTEDDEFAISSVMKKQNHLNITSENFERLRFIFDTAELLKRIKSELEREQVDVIILDAFSDIFAGDLHRTNDVRTFLQDYSNLARKYECLIIFLHHTGKKTDDNAPSKHNMLGSQGFEAKMRLVIELRRDGIHPSKRHFCIVKGNYLPDEYKTKSFVLTFTENLTFENTGERTDFTELSSSTVRGNNDEVRVRARELRQSGNTIDQIHEILLSEGYTCSRSTIGNWVRGL